LNDLAQLFGLEAVDWLGDGSRAVWLMTLVNTFQFMGVAMVVYLAGLQAIPKRVPGGRCRTARRAGTNSFM
jgi:raffinose/stachyose/melibiose transport system permease protein